MTQEECHKRVLAVFEKDGDTEARHAMEDALWEEVLRAIAMGAENPRGLAAKALETRIGDHARWYS